ncbi:hypothetical protein ACFE04_026482 [Oxalis oulophora]
MRLKKPELIPRDVNEWGLAATARLLFQCGDLKSSVSQVVEAIPGKPREGRNVIKISNQGLEKGSRVVDVGLVDSDGREKRILDNRLQLGRPGCSVLGCDSICSSGPQSQKRPRSLEDMRIINYERGESFANRTTNRNLKSAGREKIKSAEARQQEFANNRSQIRSNQIRPGRTTSIGPIWYGRTDSVQRGGTSSIWFGETG